MCTLLLSASIVTITVLFYIRAGEYLDSRKEVLKAEVTKNRNEAIDGCFANARIDSVTGTTQKSEPLISLYHDCLKDKDIVVPSANSN